MTKENKQFSQAEHQAYVDGKRIKRMATIDGMPADLRALVNDYGLNIVQQFLNFGIRNPKQIRHLVETVLDEFSPTRGTFSGQGLRVALLDRNGSAA